jgi:hypothetical protein
LPQKKKKKQNKKLKQLKPKPEGYVFGRPTKYDPKYCEMMINFFDVPKNQLVVKKKTTFIRKGENERTEEEFETIPNDLPTLYRFARSIGVSKTTVLKWIEDHEDFLDAYNSIKDIQKEFLSDNGLRGLYPPSSFIFVAKNVTDMTDQKQIDHTSKGNALGYVVLPPEQIPNA